MGYEAESRDTFWCQSHGSFLESTFQINRIVRNH